MEETKYKIRKAENDDVKQIQIVRNSVLENQLSDPSKITDEDCINYMTERGRGWVSTIDENVVGFAIIDLKENLVWALFIHPEFEGRGIGKSLHNQMLSWYFEQTNELLSLGTAPNTRAASFYANAGWKENGWYSKDELKFEMSYENWKNSA